MNKGCFKKFGRFSLSLVTIKYCVHTLNFLLRAHKKFNKILVKNHFSRGNLRLKTPIFRFKAFSEPNLPCKRKRRGGQKIYHLSLSFFFICFKLIVFILKIDIKQHCICLIKIKLFFCYNFLL